jgi:hypothetical protein
MGEFSEEMSGKGPADRGVVKRYDVFSYWDGMRLSGPVHDASDAGDPGMADP